MADRTHYTLIVEALPGDVPAEQRLKRLLKALLRGYGMRCVSVAEGEQPTEVQRLRAIVVGLADRVAAQSELLSRAAEVRPSVAEAGDRPLARPPGPVPCIDRT